VLLLPEEQLVNQYFGPGADSRYMPAPGMAGKSFVPVDLLFRFQYGTDHRVEKLINTDEYLVNIVFEDTEVHD